jgi:hypothetical protein
VHRPERHLVGEGEQRRRRLVATEQCHRRFVPALDREAAVGVQLPVGDEAEPFVRSLVPALAEMGDDEVERVVELAADETDPAVPEIEQVGGSGLTDRDVVDADRRDPVEDRADRDEREPP